jgi:hypothetical protein
VITNIILKKFLSKISKDANLLQSRTKKIKKTFNLLYFSYIIYFSFTRKKFANHQKKTPISTSFALTKPRETCIRKGQSEESCES